MKPKITYRFETPSYPGNIIYVNIIANYSCPNDCLFCGRPRKKSEFKTDNIYEKKAGTNLYLPKSPTINQVMQEIDQEIKPDDQEIAFVGLGEPVLYFQKITEVLTQLNQKYNKPKKRIKTRIDTCGIIIHKHPHAATHLETASLDEIRISLNATNEQDYNQLCQPKVPNAFSHLIKFITECNKTSIDTRVSFVTNFQNQTIKTKSKKEYIEFAQSLGIKKENIILRNYIPI